MSRYDYLLGGRARTAPSCAGMVRTGPTSPVQRTARLNRDLNAVYCLSATSCWAVGERDSSDGTIVRWYGSNWDDLAVSPTTRRTRILRGVHSCGPTMLGDRQHRAANHRPLERQRLGDMPSLSRRAKSPDAVFCIQPATVGRSATTAAATVPSSTGTAAAGRGCRHHQQHPQPDTQQCLLLRRRRLLGGGQRWRRRTPVRHDVVDSRHATTTQNLHGVSFPDGRWRCQPAASGAKSFVVRRNLGRATRPASIPRTRTMDMPMNWSFLSFGKTRARGMHTAVVVRSDGVAMAHVDTTAARPRLQHCQFRAASEANSPRPCRHSAANRILPRPNATR